MKHVIQFRINEKNRFWYCDAGADRSNNEVRTADMFKRKKELNGRS